jgi:succinate dehydrogenase / fumarate reductase, flavoprotein subunit
MNEHHIQTADVLVIGSGAAGMRAAIAAHNAGRAVVVVGKRLMRDAHTVLAAGGINAALGTVDPEDSWQQHFSDTLNEGYYLSDPQVVEIMAKEAPQAIEELVAWGADFARTEDGKLDQRYFGAHKYRRTCYAGDYTGREILYTLADRVESLKIPFVEHQYVTSLLVHENTCFGAMTFDMTTGERTVFFADAVVLAAGGHTRLWRRSSSRLGENTGDGMYLALKAGVELADMELVQFHPTGMVAPEDWAGTLVTEAVRGEGGYLLNRNGERYMVNYDAERMELSTRDRVALANYTEIIEGRGGPNGGVFLDISHRAKAYILEKLPRMYHQFIEAQNLDISEEPMEVAPTAHYTMGGVVVDPYTHATTVSGLYAAGEVTSGLHGANRLGGNSLAETVIFGRHAGEAAATYSANLGARVQPPEMVKAAHDELSAFVKPADEDALTLLDSLRDNMWENCGVMRNEERVQNGLARLEQIREAAKRAGTGTGADQVLRLAAVLDLQGAIVSAETTLLGALERRESRGAHQRIDFPETNPQLKVNFRTYMDATGKIQISPRPVDPVREELKPWVDEAAEFEVEGRLLE